MISVTCQYGANDTLEVDTFAEEKVIANFITRNSRCISLKPDDARKVRDALTAALDAHDEKQRERRERWEKAMREEAWPGFVKSNNPLRISGEEGFASVVYFRTDGNGVSLTATALDEVIAKLTAIRDAHRERVASNEAR